jgi:hypothetical protein
MKLADLRLGTAYYYQSSPQAFDRGYANAAKIELVSLDRYRRAGSRWSSRFWEDPKGQYVKVKVLADPAHGRPVEREDFVRPVQIRCPWVEGLREEKALAAKRGAEYEAEAVRRRKSSDRLDRIKADAGAAGLKVFVRDSTSSSFTIMATDLEEFLARVGPLLSQLGGGSH